MDELTVEREDVVQALGELQMQNLGLRREIQRLVAEIARRDAEQSERNGAALSIEQALRA